MNDNLTRISTTNWYVVAEYQYPRTRGYSSRVPKYPATSIELSSDSPSKSEPIPDCPSSRCVKCWGKIRFSSLSSQSLADDRGAAPLSSAEFSKPANKNLIFPKHFLRRDEGQSAPGTHHLRFSILSTLTVNK